MSTNSAMMIVRAAIVVCLPIVFAGAAEALPRTCKITTYYKTADMTEVVGTRTNCPGGGSSGRTSRFFEVETVELNPGGPGGGGGGPGGLPCEFLAAGCSNLPAQRN